jgi:hypothetical protein
MYFERGRRISRGFSYISAYFVGWVCLLANKIGLFLTKSYLEYSSSEILA